MGIYKLNLNGREHRVQVPPEMPLLWVVRDILKLTGTKFGCGIGQCRACTVHIDGVEMFSCKLAIQDIGQSRVTTIEGLEETLKQKLVEAWIEEDVPQCGYCQPGQIMAAAALLKRVPKPSDDDIDSTMQNICRCGTYTRIRKAVRRASR